MKRTYRIDDLHDVFLWELGDLYDAENQLIKAMPRMAKATESGELRSVIEDHLNQTKTQVNRLDEIFKDLGERPRRVSCKAMEGLLEEEEEWVEKSDKSPARDAAIIGAVQRMEHYEIAAYGTAKSHASVLGHKRAEGMLAESLQEEKKADESLNNLAKAHINQEAKTCGCEASGCEGSQEGPQEEDQSGQWNEQGP